MLGGIIYTFIEILWRGYSHWSMTVLGGVCFAVLYFLYEKAGGAHLLLRCAAGSAFITAAEFLTGCIVNLRLGWNIWSYSSLRFNIFGQVSLLFPFCGFFFAYRDLRCVQFTEKRQILLTNKSSSDIINRNLNTVRV